MSEMETRVVHKQEVNNAFAQTQIEQGVFMVLTGDGKGKSTAGFGTVARALGWEQNIVVAQFTKGDDESGERLLFRKLGVPVMSMDSGFSWESDDAEADMFVAQSFWSSVRPLLNDPDIDLILLDEITGLINKGHIELEDVLEAIASRPRDMSVIVTGRNAHYRLKDLADTVSEIHSEKHSFDDGIKARKGMDF